MLSSSAATEKSVSRYGNVHTIKRNRLTTERAGKIIFASFNLKLEMSTKRRERSKQKRIMFVTQWKDSEFGLRAEELEVAHVYKDYDSFDSDFEDTD